MPINRTVLFLQQRRRVWPSLLSENIEERERLYRALTTIDVSVIDLHSGFLNFTEPSLASCP